MVASVLGDLPILNDVANVVWSNIAMTVRSNYYFSIMKELLFQREILIRKSSNQSDI